MGAYYAFPNSEDLVLALDSRDQGIINSATILLRTYDGRYFTNILHGINPLAFNWVGGHRLMPLFAISFCVGTLYYFLRAFLSAWFTKSEAIVLSAAVYLLHFWTVPSLSHELYWMVSSFVYLYPFPFIFLWTGSTYHYLYTFQGGWKNVAAFVASGLSLWAAIGLNEMFLSVNLSLLVLGGLYFFCSDRKKLKEFIPLVMIGITSIIFFVSCPGPWQRMNENSPGGGVLFVVGRLLNDAYAVFLNFSVVNWTALLFVAGITAWYTVVRKKEPKNVDNKSIILACAYLLVLGASTLLPYYTVMNEGYIPYRVYGSFVFALHAIMIIVSITVLARYVKSKSRVFFLLQHVVGVLAAVTLFAHSLMGQWHYPYKNNVGLIRGQYMSGVLQEFESEMKKRYRALNSKNHLPYANRIIELEPLSKMPDPVYHMPDIYPPGSEDEAWNGYWEDYFEVNEIILVTP